MEQFETKDLKDHEKKEHFLSKLLSRGAYIGDTDKSKVSKTFHVYSIAKITLYINLTMNEKL